MADNLRMEENFKLKFPHRHSVGSLYIAPANQPESWQLLQVPQGLVTKPENQPINWEWLDEARGNVVVPPDMKVKLKVSPAGVGRMSCLAGLAPDSIHVLDLSRTEVSDQCLAHIVNLSGLKVLELAYTAVSNAGIENLSGLTQIHTLGLTNIGITNSGLVNVGRLTQLRELWLNGTLIDDEGLAHISNLNKLILLGLSGTHVSNDGLEELYELKDLLRLYLFNTQVTEDGISELRKHVPTVRAKWRRSVLPRPEFTLADEAELDLSEAEDLLLAELGLAPSKMVRAMSDDQFWELIDLLDWDHEGDDFKVLEPCVNALAQMSEKDILAFEETLSEKLHYLDAERFARNIGRESYRGPDKYFSTSWFLNVRCCAVANGKEAYEEILENPKEMPKDLGFIALCEVAPKAYLRKAERELYYLPRYQMDTFSNRAGWPHLNYRDEESA